MNPLLLCWATRARALGVAALLTCALSGCDSKSDADLLDSAKSLLAKNDSKGAVIQLKTALQKNPQSAEARFLFGKLLLAGGDPAAALVELTKAQELQIPDEQVMPELARAMLATGEPGKLIAQFGETTLRDDSASADLKTTLATAHALQGDTQKAQDRAAEALRARPGFAPALLLQARLAAADGQADAALARVGQVLTAEPGNEAAGLLKGVILLQAKRDAQGALDAYRTLLVTSPNSVAGRSALANILLQRNEVAQAKVELERLKQSAPTHVDTLTLDAQLAFSDADYKRTREITGQILKARPNHLRALEIAGAAEYRSKAYLQAEALLGRALKLDPRQYITRMLLAQTYLRSGQPAKAIELLQPVIDAPGADGGSLALAGEAYVQLGDNQRSEAAFARALQAAPGNSQVRTSAALAQLARGDTSGASAALEALAAGDGNSRADLALVSARLRQNDHPGALKAIDGLARKMPAQALPDLLRGRVMMLKNELPAAAKSFEAALVKEPAYFPAVASLAALDLGGGQPEQARKRFRDFLQAHPGSYQAHLALAELEARTGAPATKVQAALREAVKLNPAEPRPHLILIGSLIGSGDGKGALLAAQDASATLPSHPEIMDALGRAELAAGDHQRAISTFKKLTGEQPRNAGLELRLADAYLAAQDRESAARSLRRAAEIDPDLAAAPRGLAMLALLDKKPQDALALARGLQQRKPKDAAGFVLEGDIEASRKGWDAAAAAYRAAGQRIKTPELAIKLHMALTAAGKAADAEQLGAAWRKDNPKDAVFPYYLGDLALNRQDYPRAEAQYRAVLDIQPDNALALNNVAWLMARQNKPGALALAEKANTLLPDRPQLLDTLSSALEADNQLPKAIDTQKRATALMPQDPGLTLRLAKLLIKNGDKAKARDELDKLARLGDKYAGQAEVTTLLKSL